MPWWNFGDWTHDFDFGVPPAGRRRGLGAPARSVLHGRAPRRGGPRGLPRQCAGAPTTTGSARRASAGPCAERCWVESRGLLADTPAHAHYSEQTNTMGVLLDAVPSDRREAVMPRDPSAARSPRRGPGEPSPASIYFRFYVARALDHAGLAGPLPRLPGAVEADARARPDDMGGDGRAHALGRPCLERPPELRPPDPGRRHPPRVARLSDGPRRPAPGHADAAQRPDAPPRGRHSSSATAGPATAGASRSTCPRGVSGTFLWAGRSTPLAEGPTGSPTRTLKISPGPKKRASSILAFSTLSEACTTLRIISVPKSPRMVPLAALRESVGPSRSRTLLHDRRGPRAP